MSQKVSLKIETEIKLDYGDIFKPTNHYDSEMTFGVVIPTYYRLDGSTFDLLSRALRSVLDQTYKNWIVVLIGDDYEDKQEWEELAKMIPKERMISVNLPYSLEREFYRKQAVDDNGEIIVPTAEILWFVAGSSAYNYGVQILKDIGIKYCCILDHDDMWYDDHLETLKNTYKRFPKASLVYTQAEYDEEFKIPYEEIEVNFEYNNLLPMQGKVVHSATSYNLDKYKLSFPKFNGECFDVMGYDFYPKEFKNPHDAFRWEKFPNYVEKYDLRWVYAPRTTVSKRGESLWKLMSGEYVKLI